MFDSAKIYRVYLAAYSTTGQSDSRFSRVIELQDDCLPNSDAELLAFALGVSDARSGSHRPLRGANELNNAVASETWKWLAIAPIPKAAAPAEKTAVPPPAEAAIADALERAAKAS